MTETHTIQGVTLYLTRPVALDVTWIGQNDALNQLQAAWLVLDENDYPLNPRLIGKPGVGKTTLAYTAGKQQNKPVYLFQATMDTRPEDLLVTPVIAQGQTIRYMASSVVTAMIRGGVLVLDEGNRMSERAWASLAPLLDLRRYVESLVAGIRIYAHRDFRFVTTMNEDASTYDLPDYIHSRLQPKIPLDFPDREEERRILRQNVPYAAEDIIAYIVDYLQRSHGLDLPYSVRDGINVARFAAKLVGAGRMESAAALSLAFKQVISGPDE